MRVASLTSPVARAVFVTVALASVAARASNYQLTEVPRLVNGRDANKLAKAGVHATDELLEKAATPRGRQALARRAGLPRATVVTLARRADLLRLDSISPDWVLLLEAAGVRSVADLGARDAAAVGKAVAAANAAKKIADPPPDGARLRQWVAQARQLPATFVED